MTSTHQHFISCTCVSMPAACRVAFNLAILFLLMRIWPLGGRSSGGLIPDSPDSVVVTVPFSEFVHRARTNEVQTARWACRGC
jgi:hypothetical protein